MIPPVRLSLSGSHHHQLKAHLFPGDGKEAAAIALCGRRDGKRHHRLLVHELHVVPYEICTRRAHDSISWPVEWLDDLLDHAATAGWSVVKFHSHPTDYRRFSEAGDISDAALFPGIHAIVDRDVPHASVVILPDGTMFGRTVGAQGEFNPLDAISVAGDDLSFWWNQPPVPSARVLQVGRATPAFGHPMTAELSHLSAAVVGCSGTGSIVIEQLARLGFGRLVLVDPEIVEAKNLNRILNATWDDAQRKLPKVEIARRAIEAMGLGTTVETYAANLVRRDVVEAIAECDVLFGCVDSAEGRDVLNRISTYYLLPYIDVGVRIGALADGTIDQVDGVVHYVQPGGSSLLSRHAYRAHQVAADALRRSNPELYAERQREKYIAGVEEEAPAVISINMTAAAAAVNELLARLYRVRNQPNRDFAITRINLAEMEVESEAEGNPCPVFGIGAGAGDIDPLLNLPELSG
jgi:hypothetical protein